MIRAHWMFVAAVSGSLLMNCTGVTSPGIGGTYDTKTGPVYFMPTTRIALTVTVDEKADQLILAAAQPTYIADENHRYRLNSIYSPFHAETVNFTIANGLLTKVDLESEGRLGQIIVAAAKSAFLIAESAADAPDQKILYSASIDVAKLVPAPGTAIRSAGLNQLNNEIGQAVSQYMSDYQNSFLNTPAGAGVNTPIDITVTRTFPDAPTALAETADPPFPEDCGVGFCYRIPIGYRLRADFFDHTVRTAEFEVPNGSPIYAAAVNRGIFTKWHTTATLTNGVLTGYKIVTDRSELEALVSLPADIVGAQIAALTQQGKLFDARSTLIGSEIKLIEARERLSKARTEVLSAESAAFGNRDQLFEFRAGAADPQQAGQQLNPGQGNGNGTGTGTGTPGGGEFDIPN